jgi:hypothetical protein
MPKSNVLNFPVSLLLIAFGLLLSSCSTPSPRPVPVEEPEIEYAYHRIKYSGETVAIISAWYTKSAKNWPEIVDSNPKMVPSKLRIGDIVKIPKRLMRRNSSLPQDFVTSFSSGVNKDSSKGTNSDSAQVAVVSPSETESSVENESRERTTTETSSDYTVPDNVEPDSSINKPEASDLPSTDNNKADFGSELDSSAPPAPPVSPGNDENQKIREELLQ